MQRTTTRLFVLCLAGVVAACGSHKAPVVVAAPPVPLPVSTAAAVAGSGAPVQLTPDPALALIAAAEREFAAGQKELAAGHVVAAREHFDAAVDKLLAVPRGARATASTAAAFDSLLDRISALEVIALREGDGLEETRTETAAIDELLSAAVFERPKPALTTAETVAADLARTAHDLDIPANDRVLSFVELFQGRLKDFMTGGLARGTRYLPMIRRVFLEEGIPLDLAYVPLVESAFKPNALSKASARGMWQFMPGTGEEHGLKQTFFIDERSDPEKATRAAAQYLKTLLEMFDGDWELALASYNAGPGRIMRAAERARTNDYWQLTASTRYLPRETCEYVPMIMAAMLIAKNPDLYGFEISPAEPLAFERVNVPQALDLKFVAEWSGVTVDVLRELNPELRRTTTPTSGLDLKVPVGTAATIQRQLESAGPLYVKFAFHTVKKGETITSIARRYRVSATELRTANSLSARARLRASQELMIPQRQPTGLPTSTQRLASAATPRPAAPATYRVQRGDTLYSIARRFETTVDALKQVNRLRSNVINVGDRLTIR